jgi:hypothetical protein
MNRKTLKGEILINWWGFKWWSFWGFVTPNPYTANNFTSFLEKPLTIDQVKKEKQHKTNQTIEHIFRTKRQKVAAIPVKKSSLSDNVKFGSVCHGEVGQFTDKNIGEMFERKKNIRLKKLPKLNNSKIAVDIPSAREWREGRLPTLTPNLKKNLSTKMNDKPKMPSNHDMPASTPTSRRITLETMIFGETPKEVDPDLVRFLNHDPTKLSSKKNGPIRSYAANTNQGILRDYNEDRVSIILNIARPDNKKNIANWPKISFFGIFDGHGGYSCADYLRDNLHSFIVKDKSFPEFPKVALRNGFMDAE